MAERQETHEEREDYMRELARLYARDRRRLAVALVCMAILFILGAIYTYNSAL